MRGAGAAIRVLIQDLDARRDQDPKTSKKRSDKIAALQAAQECTKDLTSCGIVSGRQH